MPTIQESRERFEFLEKLNQGEDVVITNLYTGQMIMGRVVKSMPRTVDVITLGSNGVFRFRRSSGRGTLAIHKHLIISKPS